MTDKTMPFAYNDGGRAEAELKGTTKDCAYRAVAIAAEKPYQEVLDLITEEAKRERPRPGSSRSCPRTGVYAATLKRVVARLGGEWIPTMSIGSGTTVHLAAGELPQGRLIARVSKHFVAVIDGTIHDLNDPSRGGTRAVYGYWSFPPLKE